MTDTALTNPSLRPPVTQVGVIGWMRANLFNSILNSILTIIFAYIIVRVVYALLDWGLIHAVWHAANARACRAADSGACWAFIGEKGRLILFGRFPYEDQWRAVLASVLFVIAMGLSGWRAFWNKRLLYLWIGVTAVNSVLMWGGVFGLSFVETSLWGGLPLTLILAIYPTMFSFPLAILLALGRRSRLPIVKSVCICFIELIRGVPLITLLFMASLMLPLFLPAGVTIDKLLRAVVAITFFTAAYIAEVIRGGLQALPKGQYEAADALGLSYNRKIISIILPQALVVVIPALVNDFIGVFKDTSLVTVIALFDIVAAMQNALVDPDWRGPTMEAYFFVAAIFFVFCYAMSRYSATLETTFNKGRRR
ncbi:MAG TPA: amino acid ABC transporter permease [Stellaceae bacterium]|nr:amino acid ABC transporter permease [Stellaceae bacterium]